VILASQQSGTLSWLADSMSSAGGGKPGHIEEALSSFYARLEAFVRELGKITEVQFEPILVHSRETPTHYKWYMGHTRDGSANVWLHEYKPAETRSSGYAQSVHNHRYPMSVLLLAGGYRYARYAVVPLNEAAQTSRSRKSGECPLVQRTLWNQVNSTPSQRLKMVRSVSWFRELLSAAIAHRSMRLPAG